MSLLEIGVVCALIGVLLAGVLWYYRSASDAQRVEASIRQLSAIQTAVQSLYMGQPDYDGLTSEVVARGAVLPKGMVTADRTGLRHAFLGPITLAAASGNSGWQATFEGVPAANCPKLASIDFGQAVRDVQVNGTSILALGASSPSAALAWCSSAGVAAAITWVFR